MFKKIKKEILKHANENKNIEICGLVVVKNNRLKYVRCDNIAYDKINHFLISADDFLKADEIGQIKYVVHSHINNNFYLSTEDRKCQIESGFDFILVCNDKLRLFKNAPQLIGREFKHNVQDCRNIILDCYMLSGLILPTLDEYSENWYENEDLYRKGLAEYGFYEVEKPQFGDVILFNIGGKYPNHAGILLENGEILHHQIERLSLREPLNFYLNNRINSYWRHKEWQQLNFSAIYQDLQIV